MKSGERRLYLYSYENRYELAKEKYNRCSHLCTADIRLIGPSALANKNQIYVI